MLKNDFDAVSRVHDLYTAYRKTVPSDENPMSFTQWFKKERHKYDAPAEELGGRV